MLLERKREKELRAERHPCQGGLFGKAWGLAGREAVAGAGQGLGLLQAVGCFPQVAL